MEKQNSQQKGYLMEKVCLRFFSSIDSKKYSDAKSYCLSPHIINKEELICTPSNLK